VQRVVTVAVWIFVAAAGAAVGQLALPRTGLRGHYFTNLTRSGEPVAVVVDGSISTDTLDNGTAGVWPAFSVEWTGSIVIDEPGAYQFSTLSDDGSELEVDDRIVVQNGGLHGPQEASGRITLAAGIHPIRLRYEQAGGGFALALKYGRGDDRLDPIPSSRLLPDPISFGAYRMRRAIPIAAAMLAVLLWIAASQVFARRGPPVRLSRPIAPILDRPGVALMILLVVAVGMRIFVMLGSNAILWPDSDVFLETFGRIRNGRFLEHDPFRTLLYPYFLTAFLIWNTEPPMDQIIAGAQQLLGVATIVCFYLGGRRAFGGRIALAGALLLSLHTTQLFYELSIMSETFFTFLLAASLIPMGSFVERPTVRGGIVTGIWCAVLTLTRPVAQWLVLVPLALAMWTLPTWKDRAKMAIAVAATFAAIILPWAALNQQQHGFFGVAIGRGFGLFIRVFDMERFEPHEQTAFPDVRDALKLGLSAESPATFVRDEVGGRRKFSMIQKDAVMAGYAMEAIRRQPARFVIGTFRQWMRQLGPFDDEAICRGAQGPYLCSRRTIGYAREPFLNRPRSEQFLRPWVVTYFRYGRVPIRLITALAMLGVLAYAARRRPPIRGILLALIVAYLTFVPAFAQAPQDRYRLPVDALLFMFAGVGVAALARTLLSPDALRKT